MALNLLKKKKKQPDPTEALQAHPSYGTILDQLNSVLSGPKIKDIKTNPTPITGKFSTEPFTQSNVVEALTGEGEGLESDIDSDDDEVDGWLAQSIGENLDPDVLPQSVQPVQLSAPVPPSASQEESLFDLGSAAPGPVHAPKPKKKKHVGPVHIGKMKPTGTFVDMDIEEQGFLETEQGPLPVHKTIVNLSGSETHHMKSPHPNIAWMSTKAKALLKGDDFMNGKSAMQTLMEKAIQQQGLKQNLNMLATLPPIQHFQNLGPQISHGVLEAMIAQCGTPEEVAAMETIMSKSPSAAIAMIDLYDLAQQMSAKAKAIIKKGEDALALGKSVKFKAIPQSPTIYSLGAHHEAAIDDLIPSEKPYILKMLKKGKK
jgi:hypothetical protein